jgi:hypothetical protein
MHRMAILTKFWIYEMHKVYICQLGTIKSRPHHFNIKLLFIMYKATCFDHLGGHHHAWVQDIIEEDLIMALQVVETL